MFTRAATSILIALVSLPLVAQPSHAQSPRSRDRVVGVDKKGDWGSNTSRAQRRRFGRGAGMDLARARITMAGASTLRFVIAARNVRARYGWRQAPRYLWSLSVDGRQVELDGRSRGRALPVAVRADCTTSRGRTTCVELGTVDALPSVERDIIRIDVPLSMIGARPGSTIRSGVGHRGWRPGSSLMAVPRAFAPRSNVPRDDMQMSSAYVVPGLEPTSSDAATDPNDAAAGDSSEAESSPACTMKVAPGDDIAAIVDDAPAGSTVCFEAGSYDLGGATLEPEDDVRLIGQPVTVGPNGEIEAPTKLLSSAQTGVIKATIKGQRLTIENLDVSGATGSVECKPICGRGFNGAGKKAKLTVRYSRFHDNFLSGLDGMGWGSVLEYVELDHNGDRGLLGCCAGGIKSGDGFTIRNSYVHDNMGYGIWCDEGCSFVVEGNLVARNFVDGIRDELSSRDGRSGTIRRNTVIGNNIQGKVGGHGGISIVSVHHTLVENNVLQGNGHSAIEAKDDNRGSLYDIVIRNNSLGGDPMRGCSHTQVHCTR